MRQLLLLLIAFAAAPLASASARPPDPADPLCPPAAVPPVTLSAGDLEDGDRDLTATHTITLYAEDAEGIEIDDFALALPPGVQTVRGEADSFRSDAPGLATVTAQWQHLVLVDGTAVPRGSHCTATTTATFNLEPPKPLRVSLPRPGGMSELFWRLRAGEDADLRPVEARLRGVRRARLPRSSTPAQTFTIGLRAGDKPMFDGAGRVLRSAGWRFRFGPYFRREFPIRMSKFEKSRRLGFGFELEFLQGGARIARTRGLGRCVFEYGLRCRWKTGGGATAAQAPAPLCPPGAAPAATIRGYDVEDDGGPLTATHTIVLEAHGRDGQIPRASFSLPPGTTDRTSSSDAAFSVDTAGPVTVSASWSHNDEATDTDCTATAQATLRIRPARPLRFVGVPRRKTAQDWFGFGVRVPENGDRRALELRLRSPRRTLQLALRRGDPGTQPGRPFRLEAGGWKFAGAVIDDRRTGTGMFVNASRIGLNRERASFRGRFRHAIDIVQAGRRIGRVRIVGRCATFCTWRSR
jgi:hypothetical protein